MASTRDVTDRFREAVRSAAADEGFDGERLAKVSSSLIMHKSAPRSTFTRTAVEILGNIREMHGFIVTHGKDYTDRYRTSEKDRDTIEHEVGLSVKACRESIEALKDSITAEDKRSARSGWLAAVSSGSTSSLNKDLNAHQHGMVLILSEHLHAVTAQFDQLRAGRFQEAIDKRMPKRRKGLKGLNAVSPPATGIEPHNPVAAGGGRGGSYESQRSILRDREKVSETDTNGHFQAQQQLDQETRMLQMELTNMMDAVQETESKMLEVSALNHLFSTQVLKQAQQIEVLYQQAMDATQNMTKGNKELSKATARRSSNRLWICLFVIVLTFALLFLDWYE